MEREFFMSARKVFCYFPKHGGYAFNKWRRGDDTERQGRGVFPPRSCDFGEPASQIQIW